MKSLFNTAARVLLAAARDRAENVRYKQAQVARPSKEEYRANAGGWN